MARLLSNLSCLRTGPSFVNTVFNVQKRGLGFTRVWNWNSSLIGNSSVYSNLNLNSTSSINNFSLHNVTKRFVNLQALEQSMGWRPRKPKPSNKPENLEVLVKSFQTAEPVQLLNVPRKIFGAPLRRDLIQKVVVWQRAMWRQGTHQSRNKSQKRGSSRKILKQKGSGQARRGMRRVPHFVSGGKAHGPINRSHAFRLNNKTVSLATRCAISTKFVQGNLEVVTPLTLDSSKTRDMLQVRTLHDWRKVLIIGGDVIPENVTLAARGLQGVAILPQHEINVFDILKYEKLVISTDALDYLKILFKDDPANY